MKERLQKILARAGHGSRRSAEALITAGRVTVNGARVTELGTTADADADRIEVDGQPIEVAGAPVYLAMNKPMGFLTSVSDPRGRRTVLDLYPPDLPHHVFPIGRLDRDSEGLLLLTNDGEFAHRLAHPRFELDKEYHALVRGAPSADALRRLRAGVEIEDRRTSPAEVDVVATPPFGHEARASHVWLKLIIHEGRRRQVRLMCAAVGHPVSQLVRTRIGEVLLGRLAPGKTRPLSGREVASLKTQVGLGQD
ncbi:MAG: rRNA pseudouridine synthase [Dehalococcoidia bacterium]|nr:MAG: rRNA pseudouridine synthase [Dehalococcoidia bacterium]